MDGEIAFRQHSGGHTTGPNWPTFLAWADRYIKAPPGPQALTCREIEKDLSQKIQRKHLTRVYRTLYLEHKGSEEPVRSFALG